MSSQEWYICRTFAKKMWPLLLEAHVWWSYQNISWEKATTIQAPCYSESLGFVLWRDFRSSDLNQVVLEDQGLGLLCVSQQPRTLPPWETSTASSQVCSQIAVGLPSVDKKQSFPPQMTTSGQLNSNKHPAGQKEAEACVSSKSPTLKSLLHDYAWWTTIVLLICFQRVHLHLL